MNQSKDRVECVRLDGVTAWSPPTRFVDWSIGCYKLCVRFELVRAGESCDRGLVVDSMMNLSWCQPVVVWDHVELGYRVGGVCTDTSWFVDVQVTQVQIRERLRTSVFSFWLSCWPWGRWMLIVCIEGVWSSKPHVVAKMCWSFVSGSKPRVVARTLLGWSASCLVRVLSNPRAMYTEKTYITTF